MSWPEFIDVATISERLWTSGDVLERPDGKGFYVENLRVWFGTAEITWCLSETERSLAREDVIRNNIKKMVDEEMKELEKARSEIKY